MPSQEFLNRPGSIWERTSFAGKTLPELRAEMDAQVMRELRLPPGVTVRDGSVAGVPGKWAESEHKSGKFLLYLHGGGFTLGSSGIAMPYVTELAHRFGLSTFSPDYRLAPDHVFPAGVEDCIAVYQGILEMGWKGEDIILSGESAGATLCLVLLHLIKREGLPYPKAVVALSPVTDAVPETERGQKQVLDDLPDTDEVWRVYAPGADLTDVRISPARGDLSGFPPVYLNAGGAEALMADALLFADCAARAGVDIQLKIGKDMIHTYPLDFLDYPEAREAFEQISLFLQTQWGLSGGVN